MIEPFRASYDGSVLSLFVICGRCNEEKTVRVDPIAYSEWRNGALIQNVMPDVPAGDRELLMSGTCGPCFDKLFPPEEEEP